MRASTFTRASRGLGARYGKYLEAARLGIGTRLAYRGNAISRALTYGLFIFVFSRIWTTVMAGKAELGGYGLQALIWYFIVAELPSFSYGRFFGTVAEDVKSGQIAYLVARPWSFLGYGFASAMGPALLDMGTFIVEGFALGLLFTGLFPLVHPLQAAALLVSLLLSGIIQYHFQASIALTAFWVEENAAFLWIWQKLALVIGTLMPIELLPETVRRIAVWTPFPWIAWAPGRIAVAWEGGQSLILLAGQLAWCLAAIIVSRLVYAAGRRRIAAQGG
ncbi:MAG TPA: hypothetical protein VMV83_02820 [Rectinemataceae bacterium]|nr:hypothetical protein [Rectinemataceae bacterium]